MADNTMHIEFYYWLAVLFVQKFYDY